MAQSYVFVLNIYMLHIYLFPFQTPLTYPVLCLSIYLFINGAKQPLEITLSFQPWPSINCPFGLWSREKSGRRVRRVKRTWLKPSETPNRASGISKKLTLKIPSRDGSVSSRRKLVDTLLYHYIYFLLITNTVAVYLLIDCQTVYQSITTRMKIYFIFLQDVH